MRERVTFVHSREDGIDPNIIPTTATTLSLQGLHLNAAREDRVTTSLDELPEAISAVLYPAQSFHLRYVSASQSGAFAPFNSVLSPGLHVFYTPRDRRSLDDVSICQLLDNIFHPYGSSICETPITSFTSVPSSQFYDAFEELYVPKSNLPAAQSALINYLRSFCDNAACEDRALQLSTAEYIDFQFDHLTGIVIGTAYWPPQKWDCDISKLSDDDRLEVGILASSTTFRHEELQMAGFLKVVGESKKPAATMFSFPTRHHVQDASFSAGWVEPTGLHPSLKLSVGNSVPPSEYEDCSLYAHLTLPKSVFPDRHQFTDPLFMASKNLTTIRHISTPVDLEAPEYTQKLWGSTVLLQLSAPQNSSEPCTAEVPLHLRYLEPSVEGYAEAEIPVPVVFWACVAPEDFKFSMNPFDRTHLGYDRLFGPETIFYHVEPTPEQPPYIQLKVPTLNTQHSEIISSATAFVIALGLGWVILQLLGIWRRDGYGRGQTTVHGKAE